ncbi:MAG: hypothetical protein D6732_16685 [Methanobacteriota archaeon]|nr:MAG: hypothetical protein D6732_16685 [Euryarchaeota archaeon]
MLDDLSLELKRIEFDFEEGIVHVIGKKDLDALDIDGINIRLVEGQSTKMPFWVAELLVQEGLAEFADDAEINYRTLAQLAHEEAREKRLAKLPTKLFIRRVRFEIERLSKERNRIALRKLASIEGSFNKIIKQRMRKLIQEALISSEETKNTALLEEEEWLLNRLRALLNTWQESLGFGDIHLD